MAVLLPLAVLLFATVGLVLRIEPIPSWYYHCAWWPYIFAVDALNRRLAGRSRIRDRPGHMLWLAAVSVAWWTLFEAINLRLGNWYYVFCYPTRATRWMFGALAFATVLPGIRVTLDLVANLGWLRRVPVRPLGWGAGWERASLALGLACFALPLVWPERFFPLTWGSFVFLLAPWNRRHARRSFLRDLERGEAGPFCRTLLAGLICGLLWETWNFWARTRWIYTVPGFEELKLFEMPLLGFLGFPPFAVECVVVVRCLETLRKRLAGWPSRSRRVVAATCYAVGAGATALVFWLAEPVTTDSHHVPVERLVVLPAAPRASLSRLGLSGPETLVSSLGSGEGLREWSQRTGLPETELRVYRERVALVLHRGLGQARALQLAELGIHSLDDLRRWKPAELAAALRERAPSRRDPFLERRVRVWLQGLGS